MKKTGRRKKKASRIIFIVELLVLAILVAGIFVYARINDGLRNIGTGTSVTGGTTTVDASVGADPNADADAAEENEGVSTNASMKGYTNIALVGIDTRDSDQIRYANSDTMIIASINNETGKVRLVSLYRDTLLNIGTTESTASQGDSDEGGDEAGGTAEVSADTGGSGGAAETTDAGAADTGAADTGTTDTGAADTGETEPVYSEPSGDSGAGSAGTSPEEEDYGSSESYSSYDYDDEEYDDEDYDDSDSTESSEYADNEYYNYTEDETETVSGTQLGETTAAGKYDKANAAYCQGSAKQFLTMINKNLDLNIHDYVVVDFAVVAKLVDDIDGIDVWMTREEVVHMNNYCVETSAVTGLDYEPITPAVEAQSYHLNGVQAVSYARIRYTKGNDFKRTQRQRVVIENIVSKAKERGLDTVNGMINDVFPDCYTSLSSAEIISLASQMFGYEIEETTGFPFEHIEKNVTVGSKTLDCVVPVTLADNVSELHEFLFGEEDYVPSDTVQEYSNDIKSLTGLTEASEEVAAKNSVIPNNGGEADVVK